MKFLWTLKVWIFEYIVCKIVLRHLFWTNFNFLRWHSAQFPQTNSKILWKMDYYFWASSAALYSSSCILYRNLGCAPHAFTVKISYSVRKSERESEAQYACNGAFLLSNRAAGAHKLVFAKKFKLYETSVLFLREYEFAMKCVCFRIVGTFSNLCAAKCSAYYVCWKNGFAFVQYCMH